MLSVRVRRCVFVLVILLAPAFAFAQQTGSIQGKVVDTSGAALPGVTVEAKSNVLPTARTTVSGNDGIYVMPLLPPGHYTLTFTLSGFQPASREADVQLEQVTGVDTKLSVQGVSEAVTVTAQTTYADKTSAAITSGLKAAEIDRLPVGTQYRDLINLIPGVMYTQDTVRGPSAGASGQSNVYNFDGVNVTTPLFGTLSAEPSALDIAQFTVVKGGAKAVDFNRAGGFNIDSVSKSGTNKFTGEAQFRFQTPNMAANQINTSASKYDETRAWTDVNGGGPIWPTKAFFYGSYYRPTVTRANVANAYGSLPDYDSTRNEGFGKVTLTPTSSTLVNLSYRDSHRVDKATTFGSFTAPTAGTGNEAWQRIGTADGSWIAKSNTVVSFKYTHFANPTQGIPDNTSSAVVNTTPGTQLDIANLAALGNVSVPKPIAGNAAQNAFVAPIISQYGFPCTPALVTAGSCTTAGVNAGGGTVGVGSLFDRDNFFRNAGQVAVDSSITAWGMRHNLHGGFQGYIDSEDLDRSSNGWGVITVPAGTVNSITNGQPVFYQASFQAQGVGVTPTIHSEYHSKSFEANDTINWKDWTFNVGAIFSNDTLYGQGLNSSPGTLSGFVKATATDSAGRKYQEYNIPWSKMIQPRVSATWAYNGKDTIYASYARYNPAASSLPRAASWDRNLEVTQNANFDANGSLFNVDPVASSTGKLFVPNMTPQRFDEFLVGTARQFSPALSGRAYFRYRKGTHYWEDTPNMSRVLYNEGFTKVPGTNAAIPYTPYIPNLADQLAGLGISNGGNAYVIADLDGSFTNYREFTMEAEYHKTHTWVQGSFTWSRYYGNFDQDGSSTAESNDANIFIGSSNIGDGPGRQLWDNKLGYLRGDRPYVGKLLGTYSFNWNGSVGAFFTAQSGQPWETHSYLPYASLTGSTSNTARYSEPAGSHRSPAHSQIDLNYTQELPFMQRYRAAVVFYLYNVFNSQTGYNVQPNFNAANYGQPDSFYDPRRLEMTLRFRF